MSPYAIIAAMVLGVGALGGSYIAGRSDGRKIEIAAQAKAEDLAKKQGDAMTAAAVAAIQNLRPQYTTINKGIEREFRNEVRYTSTECSHTPESWRLLDSAYQAAGGQPFGDPAGLPTSTPAIGSDPRRDH